MKKLILSALALCFLATGALGQSNTGRLVGSVASTDGVVSGATIVITDNKTGRERGVTSGSDGTFAAPQLEVGTYTVKVSVQGFKTFTATEVKIDIGREYSLPVILEVGSVSDAVTVTAGTDVLNATTGELSTTVSQKQIIELPLNGRNPLNLIGLQAGVSQNGAQNTSINGLRTSFTNITRDGLNIQDGFIRSNATDFSPGRPSVDDTGEFTIVTQNAGADQNGGAQIRLVTPRGETKFHGSLFEFNRNTALAANTFFNNRSGISIPFLNRNNFGGKLGGPLPLPRFGEGGSSTIKNKAFFFGSYEGLRTRTSSLATRTILTPSARQGTFTYTGTATGTLPGNCNQTTKVCTLNLLSLVPGINAIDPTISSRVLSALPTAGNRADIGDQLNTTGLSFNQPSNQGRNSYATRLDYDITERHAINGVFTYNKENNLRPDVDNPEGFRTQPVTVQSSTNKLLVLAYRWTPGGRFTNELRGGVFRSVVPFDRTSDKPGFFIAPPLVNGANLYSNPEVTFLSQGRQTRYYNFQDNAELSFSNHAIRFGGQLQFQQVDAYNEALIVPTYTLGTNPNTPTLVATQFPGGIGNTQLNTANGLLALLGGVVGAGVQSFNVESKTSGFKPVQNFQDFRYGDHSLYVSDQWRVKPSFTVNLGLRYELYTGLKLNNGLAIEPVIPKGADPVQAILNPSGTYDFLGVNSGTEGQYYKTDKNNFAPIFSFAYSYQSKNKYLKYLTGENSAFVVRGGYRMSYLNDQLITALNNAAVGNVGLGRTAVNAINPATNTTLLNARLNALPGLTPPSVIVPRTYAQNNGAAFTNFGTVFAINPEIQTPRVQEYNFGIQREFGANAVEIRYVGGRSDNLWRSIDFNQIDIRGNGFAADFDRARANLVLTGNPSCTTAGCQPLTVFPNLGSGGLLNNATIRNSLLAGTPADLALTYVQNLLAGSVKFLANPNTGVANLFTNGASYRYNSLQVEFRRRFSKGLYFQANYTFQKNLTDGIGTSQTLVEPFLDNNNKRLEYARADFDQTHVFNFNGVYEFPFGRDKKFFGGAGRAVDLIIGGWQLNAIAGVSTGAPITIIDPRGTLNRLGRSGRQTAATSLTKDQIKDLFGIRKLPGGVFYIDPAVINVNPDGTTGGGKTGRGAEGFGSTPFAGQAFFNVTPGNTSGLERAFINGPNFFNMDLGLAKNVRLTEGAKLQLRLEAFNALNRANFFFTQFGNAANINQTTFGRVNSTVNLGRIIQLGARIDF